MVVTFRLSPDIICNDYHHKKIVEPFLQNLEKNQTAHSSTIVTISIIVIIIIRVAVIVMIVVVVVVVGAIGRRRATFHCNKDNDDDSYDSQQGNCDATNIEP